MRPRHGRRVAPVRKPPDINLDAISRGFPKDYSDDALDALEQEAAPFAETLAQGMKDDDEFPCKLTP